MNLKIGREGKTSVVCVNHLLQHSFTLLSIDYN